MIYEEYIKILKSRFSKHFHINTDVEILGEKVDFQAKFSQVSGRTFVTQNDIIDRYENYENCYIKYIPALDLTKAAMYTEFLKNIVDETVNPSQDHMSTYITGVILTNNVDPETVYFINNFKFSKVYSFYLKGWCDIRLICVNLETQEVISNKHGKKVKEAYKLTS